MLAQASEMSLSKQEEGKGKRNGKMQLSTMKAGDRARIVRVASDESVRRHLGALGFVAGTVVRVVRTSFGNMILAVHESRVAVDGATAAEIETEPV